MSKPTTIIEWYTAQDDADWARLCTQPIQENVPGAAPATRGHLFMKQFLGGVVAILLLLASTGAGRWYIAQAELHPAKAEPNATAQQALREVVQRDDPLTTSHTRHLTDADWWLQHGREVPGLDAGVQTASVQGDLAAMRVVMTARSDTYRQTRFYRRTAEGWQPTAPDVTLWGPARSLETPSFVFHFRQNDTAAVVAVAPQVEALYTTLRQNFGLPLTPDAEKLIIEVTVAQSPGAAAFLQRTYDHFVVPSPAVYSAPVGLTDADLLAQSIALPLFDHLIAQASKRYQIGLSWQSMLNGLYLWQVWDSGLPLSTWREPVVKWLYSNWSDSSTAQRVVLPDHYKELCAAHTLWLVGPVYVGIPLLCNELDHKDQHLIAGGLWPPLARLDQLTEPAPQSADGGPYLPEPHPGATVALATLIEYAVATYGRERLPALVEGLGQYESWDTLLPAVFGVSPAEFEAGWQAYLTVHYGVSGFQ